MGVLTSKHEIEAVTNAYENRLHPKIQSTCGMYYTSTILAETLLEYLDINTEGTLFDPSCGTGTFLHAALRLGFTKVYGADIDENALKIAKLQTGISGKRLRVMDTVSGSTIDTLKKFSRSFGFDYVVGCPPYIHKYGIKYLGIEDPRFAEEVKLHGNNLFAASIIKSMDYLAPRGTLAIIIPKTFLTLPNYSKLRNLILKNYSISAIVNLGKIYKCFKTDMVFMAIKNEKPKNNDIRLGRIESNRLIEELLTIKQWFYQDEIILFKNENDKYLYEKLSTKFPSYTECSLGITTFGTSAARNRIRGTNIINFGYNKEIDGEEVDSVYINASYAPTKGIEAARGYKVNIDPTVGIIPIRNEMEMRLQLATLQSSVYTYFLNNYVLNGGRAVVLTKDSFNKLPFINDEDVTMDLYLLVGRLEQSVENSREWKQIRKEINDVLFKAFNLSEEEINEIVQQTKLSNPENW